MTAAPRIPLISVEEYLASELDGDLRHEYIGGYVHAMAGAKTVHNQIAMSLSLSLGGQLRGQTCQPFGSDMKVRVPLATHSRFYYPDGMIVSEPNGPDDTFQDRPVVIAEVVSDSTRRVDETEKRDAYLTIPTLAVYLLIETAAPRVSVYRRQAPGDGLAVFATEFYQGLDATIPLDEVSARLPLGELYERVSFSSPAADE